jgi:hypothetical protein
LLAEAFVMRAIHVLTRCCIFHPEHKPNPKVRHKCATPLKISIFEKPTDVKKPHYRLNNEVFYCIRVKGVEPSHPKILEPKSKQHPLYHRLKPVKMDLGVIDSHRSP